MRGVIGDCNPFFILHYIFCVFLLFSIDKICNKLYNHYKFEIYVFLCNLRRNFMKKNICKVMLILSLFMTVCGGNVYAKDGENSGETTNISLNIKDCNFVKSDWCRDSWSIKSIECCRFNKYCQTGWKCSK